MCQEEPESDPVAAGFQERHILISEISAMNMELHDFTDK